MMRGGDKAAFGVLFDRYYDLLHTFARHIVKDSSVAEDIIQNVFVKMWMRKEQVNPELSVRNYLLVATRNELFDYMCYHRKVCNRLSGLLAYCLY